MKFETWFAWLLQANEFSQPNPVFAFEILRLELKISWKKKKVLIVLQKRRDKFENVRRHLETIDHMISKESEQKETNSNV